ncbi:MAG TPA: hypothetical protein VGK48_07560 [Terriglobia bacterium]|jgi:hypothetical protein
MKKAFWLFLGLLLAMPAFAQDEGGGGGGGVAGGGGNQVFTRIDPVNPLEPVKAFLLSKASITLTPDEEKALRPIVEAEVQQLRDLQTKFAGQPPAQPQGGGRRNGRGRGGAPDANSLAALQNGPAAEQFKKINDEMLAKTTAALNSEHQAALKKYLNTELKKAGGFGALKVTMEEAGAPLSSEQEPQIQTFYSDDAQQRTQLMKESQGHPDPAKLADIDKATMGKVVKVLTDAQKKALIASRTKQN